MPEIRNMTMDIWGQSKNSRGVFTLTPEPFYPDA